MEYRELFDIEIIHPYFSEISGNLVLVSENETRKRLKGLGYILKKTFNGIKVLAPVLPGNDSFQSLREEDNFTFYVYPTSEHTQEITDFSEIDEGNMISFTNANSSELITNQTERRGVLCGFPSIANIVIVGNKINTNRTDRSTNFQAIFKTKSIKWMYYFVSNSENPSISLESRGEQISFNEVVIDENTTDQIIDSIELNFPNTQIKVFESADLVPFSSNPIKNIKLLQDGDVLISHVPNPQKEHNGIQIIKIK